MRRESLEVAIVDSDDEARRRLRAWLLERPDISIAGEAAGLERAADLIRNLQPHLVFSETALDGADAFPLADLAGQIGCALVFVTADPRAAVRAFDVNALDFVLKPWDGERLEMTLGRFGSAIEETAETDVDDDGTAAVTLMRDYIERIALRTRDRYILVRARDIHFIEAAGNYVRIHTADRSTLFRSSLTQIEQRFDPSLFTRIHRSTIVNVEFVTEVIAEGGGDFIVVLVTGEKLRMSRNYRRALLD